MTDGAPDIVTVMTASVSLDQCAIDAAIMRAFKDLVERPLDILT